MKKLIFTFFAIALFANCKEEKKESKIIEDEPKTSVEIEPISDEVLETAVIYEANIRQYSPEGTFDEFTKDIPTLKALGVKVIWLMPVFPISETKRKAEGGKFASEFPEEEQAKYLGSYYAVTDFTKINPEFGNKEDFRELVKTAHENGIYVILDWVPNHTGWDHEWIKNHPEYYTKNESGEIIHPKGTDWTDVADLNYDNQSMRQEMIEDMLYWVKEEGVDGFRCDVAGSVPLDFWKTAISILRSETNVFMLAEAWEPELLDGDLFDMAYAWDGHHLMNAMAKGEKTTEDFDAYINKVSNDYDEDDILMNFITNHDENSWNGTIKERMGDKKELFTALKFLMPGMPLIYSGQEYDMDHRLKFFEKDSIPKTKGEYFNLLKKLGELKNTNPALNGGKNAADYKRLNTESDILMFERSKDEQTLLFVGNFSDAGNKIAMPKGKFLNYLSNEELELVGDAFELNPWEYKILIKK
ncbi:alpha-amlyase [Winogradskyella sp. J14-2]|uniref:alpha-amylase family glycosyl hydrolase n=1 Tax=Winogradskyella sp. J14-2 TaxID=1936080 RepID=UPI000972AD35|nr:alpha-amylase family glycosyl hydrolase [Winogradskyella sp. J14-2]APY08041.1 alpha-amlyase [Winogradskyella sp. J14-2]